MSTMVVGDLVAAMDRWYPPATADDWDRVGLVAGDPAEPVTRVLLAVDCVAETVEEALAVGAQLMIVHHPLLLRGVHSVATTSYKGALLHRLIRAGVALFVAHTNADGACPGVTDALADRLDLRAVRPLVSPEAAPHHPGRVGDLPAALPLDELVGYIADRLPATVTGVRAAGDPKRVVSTLALVGGAGDGFLADVTAAGVDAFLTADLRHHPASEHLAAGGPALLDAAHWATERPWLDALAPRLRELGSVARLPEEHLSPTEDLRPSGLEVVVSDLVTDVWTASAQGDRTTTRLKEHHP